MLSAGDAAHDPPHPPRGTSRGSPGHKTGKLGLGMRNTSFPGGWHTYGTSPVRGDHHPCGVLTLKSPGAALAPSGWSGDPKVPSTSPLVTSPASGDVGIFFLPDHYMQVLSCKQGCVTELASQPGREKPLEDFLPSHFNYLQFAYYNSK